MSAFSLAGSPFMVCDSDPEDEKGGEADTIVLVAAYVIVIRLGRLTRGREANTAVIQGCHSRFRLAAWKVSLAHFALFSWFLLRSSRKADILGGEYPVPTSGD